MFAIPRVTIFVCAAIVCAPIATDGRAQEAAGINHWLLFQSYLLSSIPDTFRSDAWSPTRADQRPGPLAPQSWNSTALNDGGWQSGPSVVNQFQAPAATWNSMPGGKWTDFDRRLPIGKFSLGIASNDDRKWDVPMDATTKAALEAWGRQHRVLPFVGFMATTPLQ